MPSFDVRALEPHSVSCLKRSQEGLAEDVIVVSSIDCKNLIGMGFEPEKIILGASAFRTKADTVLIHNVWATILRSLDFGEVFERFHYFGKNKVALSCGWRNFDV